MINATLCTTNTQEPWAANVDFTVAGAEWLTVLNSDYAHYKNLTVNNKAVIVYKTQGFEIIAKGLASVADPDSEGFATAAVTLTWLRLVEDGAVQDFDQIAAINKAIATHL